MSLHVIEHPLAAHWLNTLRQKDTSPEEYRLISDYLTGIVAIEASRDYPTVSRKIQTPLAEMDAGFLKSPLVVISILRAGISMVGPITRLFPTVSVGYIGMERHEETAEAHTYYRKLPALGDSEVFVVDPMLATGGSASYAIEKVYASGAKRVKFLCLVAAPEGVGALQLAFPDLQIFTTALDEQLDENKFIVPGLGDFGDRLFGT